MSQPTPTVDQNRPEGQPQRGQFPLRRVLLVAILIYAGIMAFGAIVNYHVEVARWHQAAAMDDYLDEDLPAAIQHMDDAISWNEDDPDLFAVRAQYKTAMENFPAALEDYDKALELAPDRPSLLFAHTSVLQKMGRHDEALAEAERTLELTMAIDRVMQAEGGSQVSAEMTHAQAHNQLAYTRAIADKDLDQALTNIQKGIELESRIMVGLGYKSRPPDPAFADTQGFVLYKLGSHEEALKDLKLAVHVIEKEYKRYYGPEGHALKRMIAHDGRSMADVRELKFKERALAEHVAVMRYHRGLVLEKLGKAEQAKEDYDRVKELGFTPGEQLY